VYLLRHFAGAFDVATIVASHAGIVFATGGVSGILAGVIGGGVVGRGSAQLTALMGAAMPLPDGPAKGSLMQQAAALKQRVKMATRLVIALQMTALVCMAVGHYV
jgi:alanine dehydrogenase